MTMKERLSKVARGYPASGIRRMFDIALDHPDAIKLTVGEPNFDTPGNIREAAKAALDEGYTRYNPNQGMPELREAVAARYARYGNGYTAANVMVTVGAMEAIMLCLYAATDPSDEVLVPDPCFPNYFGQILVAGAVAVPVPVYEEKGFFMRAEDIGRKITPRTRMLLLNSPSNPLGTVIPRDEIEKIAELVREHDLIVISDEVYDRIMFDGAEYFSIAQLPGMAERTLVINSFSKTYAMTGWRIGYVLGDDALISVMPRIQEGLVSCVSTFTQRAAARALTDPASEAAFRGMLADYARRRDILTDGLNAIPGIACGKTTGSFYSFPNIKALGVSSQAFAEDLVRKAEVVVVPGSAFGDMGEGYFRAVFANSDENLIEAVRRIGGYIRENY